MVLVINLEEDAAGKTAEKRATTARSHLNGATLEPWAAKSPLVYTHSDYEKAMQNSGGFSAALACYP